MITFHCMMIPSKNSCTVIQHCQNSYQYFHEEDTTMQRYQMISQNELEQIHENSLRIMENIGVIMTHAPALEILKKRNYTIHIR